MTNTRRNWLKLAGGSAVGVMLTPAPWRLITDTALWSENWPGIPRPARGEITFKQTHCSLCPAGCAVRARCVGGQPVSLAGVAGGLCAFGITAHHLPYHPGRLKDGPATEASAAVADAIAKRRPGERVAVLDLRPGRTASWTFRRAMTAIKDGVYLAPRESKVAVDLSRAKTVLSLGAPLLENWAAPARVFAARGGFRLIQADPLESRTAALADEWLPIRPGSESSLALALAGSISHTEAARTTGLAETRIGSLADELAAGGPALVIDREMSDPVIALNLKLGAWGRTLGPREEAPVPPEWRKAAPPTELASVPDGSIRVLLIDESVPGRYIPWNDIRKKLAADDPQVVVFGWSRNGYGRHAKWVLPTAVFPEALDDLPTPIDSPAPTFRLTVPLVEAPAGVVKPAEFAAALAGLNVGDALRERTDLVLGAGSKELSWTGPASKAPPPVVTAESAIATSPAVLAASAPALTLVSPLLSKIYQESNLQLAPNCIALHPKDAGSLGLADDAAALLETAGERWRIKVSTDSSVRPGTILAPRPDMAGELGKVVRV